MPKNVDLADILRASNEAMRSAMHSCMPGIVMSYNADTQTADIAPAVLNPLTDPDTGDQDVEQFPVIPNVMIVFPRGGGFHCSFDLVKGDCVVLVFSELSTAQWRVSGDISEPLDTRRQSLSYPFAFPGAFPNAAALKDRANPLYSGKMVMGLDGEPTGSIRASKGSIECGGTDPLVTASAVQTVINAMQSTIVTALNLILPGPSTPGGPPAAAAIQTAEFVVQPATVTKGQ